MTRKSADSPRSRTTAVFVTGTLILSLADLGACSKNPPPAAPAGASAGNTLGGLYFDPLGADFTLWVKRFKNEVYKNWVVPKEALEGFKGHVEFEFTVERDGTMASLHMLRASGTPATDRAAQNALVGSRFLPLPSDYGPPRITMRVTLYYNEGPDMGTTPKKGAETPGRASPKRPT
jgi:TonB family protein